MDRRRFLGTTLAGSAVTSLAFGLDELLQASDFDGSDAPKFWIEARKAMTESGRPALVFVAPRGSNDRRTLGQELFALLERLGSSTVPGRALTAEGEIASLCHFVCLTRPLAERLLKLEGNCALVYPDGEVLAQDTFPFQSLSRDFPKFVPRLVRGKDDAHLTNLAQRSLARLTDDDRVQVTRALRTLTDPGLVVANIQPARDVLAPLAPRIVPALVRAHHDAGTRKGKVALSGMLPRPSRPTAAKPVLPYGAELPRFNEVCGHWEEIKPDDEIIVIDCGMARPTPSGRRYLKFIAK